MSLVCQVAQMNVCDWFWNLLGDTNSYHDNSPTHQLWAVHLWNYLPLIMWAPYTTWLNANELAEKNSRHLHHSNIFIFRLNEQEKSSLSIPCRIYVYIIDLYKSWLPITFNVVWVYWFFNVCIFNQWNYSEYYFSLSMSEKISACRISE